MRNVSISRWHFSFPFIENSIACFQKTPPEFWLKAAPIFKTINHSTLVRHEHDISPLLRLKMCKTVREVISGHWITPWQMQHSTQERELSNHTPTQSWGESTQAEKTHLCSWIWEVSGAFMIQQRENGSFKKLAFIKFPVSSCYVMFKVLFSRLTLIWTELLNQVKLKNDTCEFALWLTGSWGIRPLREPDTAAWLKLLQCRTVQYKTRVFLLEGVSFIWSQLPWLSERSSAKEKRRIRDKQIVIVCLCITSLLQTLGHSWVICLKNMSLWVFTLTFQQHIFWCEHSVLNSASSSPYCLFFIPSLFWWYILGFFFKKSHILHASCNQSSLTQPN